MACSHCNDLLVNHDYFVGYLLTMKRIIGERTAKHILEEVLQKADLDRFFVSSNSGPFMHGHSDEAIERFNQRCADEVGKRILELPESDREIINSLSSEEFNKAMGWVTNAWSRPRPEKPITRKRSAVSLSGTRVQKTD